MRGERSHSVQALLCLLLYGLFALLSLLLVLIGARVYQGITDGAQARSSWRASLSYVANKVRAADGAGRIRLTEEDGATVLMLGQGDGTVRYETCIYYHDGALRELLQRADTAFSPDKGEPVVALEDFTIREEGPGLLVLEARAGGETHAVHVALRADGTD